MSNSIASVGTYSINMPNGSYVTYTYTSAKNMTVAEWYSCNNISESDVLAYPNARTAYELQQSPLGKALA